MLQKALNNLKTYDWGDDPKVLEPIDDAIVTSHGDEDARKELEAALLKILQTDITRCAKDTICRKLRVVGSAASAPALAKLLGDEQDSHMARYALECIPAAEAGAALREALPRLDGQLKIGVLSSLGARQEDESVAALASHLDHTNAGVARSAALALGAIRSPAASRALSQAKATDPKAKMAAIDATLACAEQLLSQGNHAEALAIYKGLVGGAQPKHVRLAATRGILACAKK